MEGKAVNEGTGAGLTSRFLSLARLILALERRKSPPKMASLLPKVWFTEGTPRLVAAWVMGILDFLRTSDWTA